jgi:hypothetical protein
MGFCNKSDNEGKRVAEAESEMKTGLDEYL